MSTTAKDYVWPDDHEYFEWVVVRAFDEKNRVLFAELGTDDDSLGPLQKKLIKTCNESDAKGPIIIEYAFSDGDKRQFIMKRGNDAQGEAND